MYDRVRPSIMSATYQRLSSGAWAVRVQSGEHAAGDVVVVAKRDGSTCYATLGDIVQCGGRWTVHRLAASGPSPSEQRLKHARCSHDAT